MLYNQFDVYRIDEARQSWTKLDKDIVQNEVLHFCTT
jgi:hypothetical protein